MVRVLLNKGHGFHIISLNGDVMDEDYLIERELENGIELAVEDDKKLIILTTNICQLKKKKTPILGLSVFICQPNLGHSWWPVNC